MGVRNFWIEADVDGRTTKLAGGPQSKDGGMSIRLYQRDNGTIRRVVDIDCWVGKDGALISNVSSDYIEEDKRIVTKR